MFNAYFQNNQIQGSSIAPGSQITVSVFIDASTPINAFDFSVSFPKDKLQFLGSDNVGSIVDVWRTPPRALSGGEVNFSGGLLKAYSGQGGEIVNLSFKTISPSTPSLSFVKTDLYLADGKGTKADVKTQNFYFSVAQNGKVLSAVSAPFKGTQSDVVIAQEVNSIKSQARSKSLEIYFVIVLIVAILIIWVYNKRKRRVQ